MLYQVVVSGFYDNQYCKVVVKKFEDDFRVIYPKCTVLLYCTVLLCCMIFMIYHAYFRGSATWPSANESNITEMLAFNSYRHKDVNKDHLNL